MVVISSSVARVTFAGVDRSPKNGGRSDIAASTVHSTADATPSGFLLGSPNHRDVNDDEVLRLASPVLHPGAFPAAAEGMPPPLSIDSCFLSRSVEKERSATVASEASVIDHGCAFEDVPTPSNYALACRSAATFAPSMRDVLRRSAPAAVRRAHHNCGATSVIDSIDGLPSSAGALHYGGSPLPSDPTTHTRRFPDRTAQEENEHAGNSSSGLRFTDEPDDYDCTVLCQQLM